MGDAKSEDLVVVSVRCPGECSEAVHAVFHELGLTGTVEEPAGSRVVVRVYLPADSEDWSRVVGAVSDRLVAVREAFGAEVSGPTVTFLAGEDWSEAWKKDYKLVRVGRVVIKPSWMAAPREAEGKVIVELDPQMAFGSGAHSSTRLALAALQRMPLKGAVIADVGTGTGVLAIAAALMGAHKVYAIDHDPIAIKAARANVRRNGVADVVDVVERDLLSRAPKGLDGIVANISPAADVKVARRAPRHLVPDGWIVLSGFTEASQERVARAMNEAGMEILHRDTEGEWVCLTGRLAGDRAGHNDEERAQAEE